MKKIVVIIFVALLFTPLFMGDFKDLKNVHDFKTADKYISESFGLREELIRANAQVNVLGLGSSPNSEVVVGKDGWLFLSEDFQKRSVSREEWAVVAAEFAAMESGLEEEGRQFLIVLVPNKGSVYPEFLPDRLSEDFDGNYEKFVQELERAGVSFVDLKGYFLDLKRAQGDDGGKLFYSSGDTHWNRLGAFMAYKEVMMRTFGIDVAEPREVFLYGRFGDLSRMVGLNEEEESWDVELADELVKEKMGSLLFFYDSFGEGLLPYLQRSFNGIDSSHVEKFLTAKKESNFGQKSDYVIVQVVERDLEEYLTGSAKGN